MTLETAETWSLGLAVADINAKLPEELSFSPDPVQSNYKTKMLIYYES